MTLSDWQLLTRFAQSRDQQAFTDLAARHLDFVYTTAKRMLGGPGSEADDATQAVFLLLSQKARTIRQKGTLTGWLYHATRYCCAKIRKSEGRRKKHEREAGMLRQPPNLVAEDLHPLLDEALASLGERERQTILVRYLHNRTAAAAAGETLGISPEATQKRLERALAKLRTFFSKKGYAVPAAAIVTCLLKEQAQAAPASLILQIGAASAASATAITLASAAKGAMLTAKLATAALIAISTLVAATIAAGIVMASLPNPPVAASPPPPATAPVFSPAAGPVYFARWDVLMDARGIARLKEFLTPVATQSIAYEALTGDFERLRFATVRARAAGELLALPSQEEVVWASLPADGLNSGDFNLWTERPSFQVRYSETRFVRLSFNGDPVNHIRTQRLPNAVRLRIAMDQDLTLQLWSGQATLTKPARMQFDAEVPVDQAVVLAANAGTVDAVDYWHVSVWHTFRVDGDAVPYLARSDLRAWLDPGPQEQASLARQAILWNANASTKLGEVAPAFDRRLPNGARLRLVAASAHYQWPGCWWDPEGRPIIADPSWGWMGNARDEDNSRSLSVAFFADDLTLPEVDPRLADGDPAGSTEIPRRAFGGGFWPNQGPLEIGLAAGPWTKAGVLKMGEAAPLQGGSVTLKEARGITRKNRNMMGNTHVTANVQQMPEMELRIVAVDKSGRELSTLKKPQFHYNRRTRPWNDEQFLESINADIDDIDHYEIQWRTISWTAFDVLATAPRITPETVRTMPPPRPPEPGSPEAFVNQFREMLTTGDAARTRALIHGVTPIENRYADMMADYLSANEILRAAAEKRFGPDDSREALRATDVMTDRVVIPPFTQWHVVGDQAWLVQLSGSYAYEIGPFDCLVKINGAWRMRYRPSALQAPDALANLEKQMPMYRKILDGRRALVTEIEQGKFKDAQALADALRAQMKGL